MSLDIKVYEGGNGNRGNHFQTTFDDGENELRSVNGVALGRLQSLGGQVIHLIHPNDTQQFYYRQ